MLFAEQSACQYSTFQTHAACSAPEGELHHICQRNVSASFNLCHGWGELKKRGNEGVREKMKREYWWLTDMGGGRTLQVRAEPRGASLTDAPAAWWGTERACSGCTRAEETHKEAGTNRSKGNTPLKVEWDRKGWRPEGAFDDVLLSYLIQKTNYALLEMAGINGCLWISMTMIASECASFINRDLISLRSSCWVSVFFSRRELFAATGGTSLKK